MEFYELLNNSKRKRKSPWRFFFLFYKTVAVGKMVILYQETIMKYIINGLEEHTSEGSIKSKQVATFWVC